MQIDTTGRRAGLLLHPTSLPAVGGIGTLGDASLAWIDVLADAGQRVWQVLPLGPTSYGNSPYMSTSAFAGNPLLIDLPGLTEAGWLDADPLRDAPPDGPTVDFDAVIAHKRRHLHAAWLGFQERATDADRDAFESFCDDQSGWLGDFALFSVLRETFDMASWSTWPEPLKSRDREALEKFWREHRERIEEVCFVQWLFRCQWDALKRYANERGVSILGDIPIFVAYDSADVWAHPSLFWLDDHGEPEVVAGVPPDYFSETGQLWGNPLYRWDALAETGYRWWVRRFSSTFELVDEVRIDHFRGFAAYWEVPAEAETAVGGRWVRGPGRALFDAVREELGPLGIVAEDLGVITPDVEALRDALGYPGMKVLHFAFGGDANNGYLPHNYPQSCVLYTGTHDNDTTVGWYLGVGSAVRDHVRRYGAMDGNDIAWQLMRLAWSSAADLAVAPVQDVLGLGSDARMNTPGTSEGNWAWRLSAGQLQGHHAERLRRMTHLYGRTAPPAANAEAEPEEDYEVIER